MERRSTTAAVISTEYEPLRSTKARRWDLAWKRRGIIAALAVSDFLLALLVWQLASALQSTWGQHELSGASVTAVVPIVVTWVALRALLGLYPGYGLDSSEELRWHTYATIATLAILATLALNLQFGHLLSRLFLALIFLGLLLLTPFVRYLVKRGLKGVGMWGKPVVVLSYNETGPHLVDLLKEHWELGYDPIAIFNFPTFEHRLAPARARSEGMDSQQALLEVVDLARDRSVNTAIFAMPYTRREQLAKLVSLASLYFRHVLVIPNLSGITNSAVVARNLAGTLAVEVKYNLLNPWALRAKRTIDLCATLVGGALLLPLFLVLALLVYVESGAPVFYADRRMGRNGNLFSCPKFRTMVPDAEAVLQRILKEDACLSKEYARYHKLRPDPRVTKVGRFLRKTSLDELPQLWNVLKGEMSLVGPRPYLPREFKEIGIAQSEILRVPPGLTGPWQVAGRNHASFEDRVQMDAYYVRDWSVWLDLVLLARTMKSVVLGRGAY